MMQELMRKALDEMRGKVDDFAPPDTFAAMDALTKALVTVDDAAGADAKLRKSEAIGGLLFHQKALGWLEYRCPGKVVALIESVRGHSGMAAQVNKVCRAITDEAKAVRQASRSPSHLRLASQVPPELRSPVDALEGAPTEGVDFSAPTGWKVDSRGVWQSRQKGDEIINELVCSAPIVVTGYGSDVETDQCVTELTWRIGNSWRRRVVPLAVAGDSRSIVAHLRPLGAPVTSANARQVVQYLDHQMSAGLHTGTTKETRAVSRMGWVKVDGAWSFVWGREVIGPARLTVQADDGFAQLADACVAKGSWEGYVETMAMLDDAPGPWVMMLTAISSVLALPLGVPGFTLDMSGDSSSGKSTSAMVGLSAIGMACAPKPGVGTLRCSWKDTLSNIERNMAFLGSLPLFLDDSAEAQHDDKGSDVLYMLTSGGKGRGRPDGNRPRESWRLNIASTGEGSVLEMAKKGGAAARTLPFSEQPMGGESEERGRLAELVERRCEEHHGQLLPRVVRRVLELGFDRCREEYEVHRQRTAAYTSPYGKVAGRLSAAVALMAYAAELCVDVGLPMPTGCDPIALAMKSCLASGREADKPREALERLYSWCTANKARFWCKASRRPPSNGWVGRWDHTEDVLGVDREATWEWIGVFPSEVEELLRRQGFDVGNVLAAWQSREWLDCPEGKNRAKKVRMGGPRPRMLVIKRSAIDGLG